MRWDYFTTGLAFIGIGATLMLAIPPPGWPKIPLPLVHILIVIGAVLTIIGAIVAVFGMWPVIPNPKPAILGMGISILLFGACAAWFWIIPESSFSPERPLRRLIAYGRLDLIVPWNGSSPQFHGYNVGVQNVSSDTITARVMFINVDVDGTKVMSSTASQPVIIPQTQGTIFQGRHNLTEDVPVSMDAKKITVEFEVDYDAIPESGIRRSYRKIAYPLNWANGKNSAPLLEPQTVDEWER